MPEMTALSMTLRKNRVASFTLIELLTVMAVISILAAVTMAAFSGAWARAARSRASTEIQAMTTGLDAYKTDNGSYPATNFYTSYPMSGTLLTNSTAAPYFSTTLDGTSTAYITNSQVVYQALSGQTNFTDTTLGANKAYMSFKRNQVGDVTGGSYVKDPWGYSYGYSIGTTNNAPTPSYPYNGTGFFDLWSTGGLLSANANTNAWISNWQ